MVGASAVGFWMQTERLDGFLTDLGRKTSMLEQLAVSPRHMNFVYAALFVGNAAMLGLAMHSTSRRRALPPWMAWGLVAFLVITSVVQTIASVACDRVLLDLLGYTR